jgi:hypothetical protein
MLGVLKHTKFFEKKLQIKHTKFFEKKLQIKHTKLQIKTKIIFLKILKSSVVLKKSKIKF